MRVIPLAAAVALVACGSPVPETPTYFADVQPILQANCARCHGADPIQPQLSTFRLDRYVKDDPLTFDAYDYRDAIVEHSVDLAEPVMPPDHALSTRQREILRRWNDAGAPKGTRPNQPPQAELVAPVGDAVPAVVDQTLDLELRSFDPDGDGLWVSIVAREAGSGEELPLTRRFGSGLRTVTLDTGTLASGRTFEVLAVLDDGYSDNPVENRVEVPLLAALAVDHGAKGTAPTVTLLRPNGGQTLLGETEIAWSANDPDPGDALTVKLDLYRLRADSSLVLAKAIAEGLPAASQTYLWTPTDVPAENADGSAIRYKIRVTVADAIGNTRSDDSDLPFTLAPPPRTTTHTWEDVKPFFLTYCTECHGQPARTVALEDFRLDKYDASDPQPPTNGDPGVYELRERVYQKTLVDGSMPPASEPQPTPAELEQLKDWLLGGAPKGGGSSDGLPTFTWNTPNDSAVTKTTTGQVALNWSASDPEGLPLQSGTISYAEISAAADATATCGAATTGWIALTGIDISTGGTTWTAPKLGYFCFKGEVVDAAGQKTTQIAAKPVKYAAR